MTVKFPQKNVTHKRRVPHTPTYARNSWFGVAGKVLSYNDAMKIYYKIQNFFDRLDVEIEIDYHEQEGDFTKEQAAKLRAQKEEIVEDYRGALEDDGHWNDVLMDILNGILKGRR